MVGIGGGEIFRLVREGVYWDMRGVIVGVERWSLRRSFLLMMRRGDNNGGNVQMFGRRSLALGLDIALGSGAERALCFVYID